MPLVSVIVPNYNHASFLRQRLDSIFNQTFRDFEVIILDDCSLDNSKEIIEEYRGRPQVSHIVYNETNSGSPFKQWAKGFNLTQSKYIWIAESDDWAEPNYLTDMVAILNNDQNLSLAFCNSYVEDNSRTPPISKNTFEKSKKIPGFTMLKKYLAWGCFVYNASSVIFRREVLSKIPSDYQTFFSSGDYLFWIYLAESGDFFYNFNTLNHYRIHGNNVSLKKLSSGQALKEDYFIYIYLKKKNYYSLFEKNVIILQRLELIKRYMQIFPNEPQIRSVYNLYRKEIFSVNCSKLIVTVGTFFWNVFHQKKRDSEA